MNLNVYIIIYATLDGNTGHSALAVDNYEIRVYDKVLNDSVFFEYDTVKKGTLTYFDLWPKKDFLNVFNVNQNLEPQYNKLPRASYEEKITLNLITSEGIQNIKNYPCDGLLMFKTSPTTDYNLIKYMDSLITENKAFHTRKNNCSDFVLYGVEQLIDTTIWAKEFIPFSFSTTPNKLYKKLIKVPEVHILVDAGDKVKGSFIKERILKKPVTTKEIKVNKKK